MPEAAATAGWLQRIWYGRERGGWLRPLGWLYGLVVAARRGAYAAGLFRRERVAAPVIVVGNLTAGGTGKTPLTAWIATRLAAQGRRPGIATRGHGRRTRGVLRVGASSTADEVGDEPLLLARRTGLPVCVAARRADAARALLAAGCDVVVCDDGLQHLALARDLEIAVVDAARGMGNGRLLPAGPLREPAARLAAVDLVVLNAAAAGAAVPGLPADALHMRLAGDQVRPVAGAGEARPLAAFQGMRVHAVAGIGNPPRFFAQLQDAGIEPVEHAFPDHHPYRRADLVFGDDLPVLMTEKDAVKCAAFADGRCWYLPVEATFAVQDAARLAQCLEASCRKWERSSGD